MSEKKKFKMPHAYVIIFSIVVLCAALTWVLPAGEYERYMDEDLGRNVVVPNTYAHVESNPVDPWEFVIALYDGMVEAGDIIFFIFFAFGYVHLLTKTGTLNAAVGAMLRVVKGRDHLLIPVFMLFFGIAGSTFGMYEETYGLIPAFMVISTTLGYDRIVGGSMIFVGVATGFAAATINPFTIGIASNVAEIPLVTGPIMTYRLVSFVLFMALSITYVMIYAAKVKKDPTKSACYGDHVIVAESDAPTREEVMALPFTGKQQVTILGFFGLIAAIAIGVAVFGWYLSELAGLFFVWMVVTAAFNKMTPGAIADSFVEAVQTGIYGALIIGIARAISVILSQANIIDTVVYYMASFISSVPVAVTAIGMLVAQNIINFFIISGSGQALVTMPLMAPLADVVGLSREVAVIAYQYGDGFSNMFWPTAVAVECGIMGIGMNSWYKFITPLFLMMFVLQAIMLTVAVFIGI